jgi:fumarate reductase subunit D
VDAFWSWRNFFGFLYPRPIILLGIVIPLGWVAAPDYKGLVELIQHPISRIYLFALISLSLFHWAHRFRFTLYDGLQLKHLEQYIVVFCYGSAIVGTVLSAVIVFSI